MHKGFADWFRNASVSPSADELKARFAATEAASEHVTGAVADVIDLVRVVFEPDQKASQLDWFVDALKEGDPTLPLERNDNVLTVLAGCSLALLLESTEDDWSDLATLIEAASFRGSRQPAGVPALLELSRATVARQQRKNREIAEPAQVAVDALVDGETLQDLKELKESPDLAGAIDVLSRIGERFVKLPGTLRTLKKNCDVLHRQSELQREEIDMLWTVLAAWVKDLDKPLAVVKRPALGVVVGRQLADLTRINPAPLSLGAIITRALTPRTAAEKCTVEAAVDAVPDELLAAWALPAAEIDQWGRLVPLHYAITKAREDRVGWKRLYAHLAPLAVTDTLSARDFALQAYNERLAMKQFLG